MALRYNIGLDFGTHQTKVCIHDEELREFCFLEFYNPHSRKRSYLIPSAVELTGEGKLYYGFLDNDILVSPNQETKIDQKPYPAKPIQEVIKEPKQSRKSIEAALNRAIYVKESDKVEREFKSKLMNWQEEYKRITEYNDFQKRSAPIVRTNKNKFLRYFKMGVFNSREGTKFYKEHGVDATQISIYYITYILLLVRKKLNAEFSVQIGMPSGFQEKDYDEKMKKALFVLGNAYALMELFESVEEFTNASIECLNGLINDNLITDSTINKGLNAIPEAYAALISVKATKKLPLHGIYLLVDIGGGTTDITLFNTETQQKFNIAYTSSVSLGLNNVFESFLRDTNQELTLKAISQVHKQFKPSTDSEKWQNPIKEFFQKLSDAMSGIYKEIAISIKAQNADFSMQRLNNAIETHYMLFSGGGSTSLPIKNLFFNFFREHQCLSKEFLGDVMNIKDDYKMVPELFPILVNSYGLSIIQYNKPSIINLDKLFENATKVIHVNYKYNELGLNYTDKDCC